MTTQINGNGNLTVEDNKIKGDFFNATVANRLMFQTSTVNGASRVGIIPNGASPAAELIVFNNSDTTSAGAPALGLFA